LSTSLDRFRASLGLLKTRRFGTFWFATLLSNLGYWAQQVAEPWLLLNLGASAFVIGLDAFMLDAPAWLLTVVGGMLADRGDRRKVIAIFQTIQMLCPIALVVLLLLHAVAPWMVVVLALVVGVTDALSMPAYQSVVPSIVEPAQIPSGLALNSIQFNLSRILGPALAGVLLASLGVIGCFTVNALSYVPFVAVALWILPKASAAAKKSLDLRHPLRGMGEVLRDRKLDRALLTVFISGLFAGPLITFLPVLIRDGFGGGARSFSIALAAFGGGGLLGAASVLASDPAIDHRRRSSVAAMLYGAVVIAAALQPFLWLVPVLAVAAGMAVTSSNTMANASVQLHAKPDERGKAVSLYMLAMHGGAALGSLGSGAAIHAIGVRSTLLVDGIVAVALQLAVSMFVAR
jgi:predicted MFS family arabinose efflux permease